MKTFSRLASLVAAFAVVPLVPSKAADVSVSFFYDNLDPYGEWVEVGDYGYCWHPRDVADDWRPYNDGNWAYTDAGWTWVSDEPYGWAVYHYGRWTRTERVGWVWVPDTEWAPAWVSWRSNDRYVGWAPLPPESRGRVGVSFGSSVDVEFDIGPTYYSFVEVRNLGAQRLRTVVLPPRENITIVNQTTNITNISYQNNVIINNGPDYNVVARQVNQPIRRLKLQRRAEIADARADRAERLGARVEGESLIVAAPAIQKADGAKPKKVGQRIEKGTIDRGWKNAGDAKQVETARAKIKEQAKNAPATAAQEKTSTQQAADPTAAPQEDRPATAQDSTAPMPADDASKPGKGKGRDRKATAAQPVAPGQPGETAATPDANAPGKVETPDQRGVAQEADRPGRGNQQRGKKGARPEASTQAPEAVAEQPTEDVTRPGKQERGQRPGRKDAIRESQSPEAQANPVAPDRTQPPGRERARENRPDVQPQSERPDRPERANRPQSSQRPEQQERPNRPERPEGVNRPERPERPERAAQPGRPQQPERPPQAERPNRERPAGPGEAAREAQQQRPERAAQPQAPQNRPPQAGGPGRGPGPEGREKEGKKKGTPENE